MNKIFKKFPKVISHHILLSSTSNLLTKEEYFRLLDFVKKTSMEPKKYQKISPLQFLNFVFRPKNNLKIEKNESQNFDDKFNDVCLANNVFVDEIDDILSLSSSSEDENEESVKKKNFFERNALFSLYFFLFLLFIFIYLIFKSFEKKNKKIKKIEKN